MSGHVLVIDRETTTTRAMACGPGTDIVARGRTGFARHSTAPGWASSDLKDLWRISAGAARQATRGWQTVAAQLPHQSPHRI